MNKYKVTLFIESDEDPSALLDEFEHQVESYMDGVELDPEKVEDGEAVCVEDVD